MSSGSNDLMGPVSRCSATPPPLNAKGGSSKEQGGKEAEEGQDKENQNENKIENDRNNKRESDGHSGRGNANESRDGNGNGDENDNKKDKRKEKRKGKRKNKHKTEDEENTPLRKPCCFCWCCCCSCSCLAVKSGEDDNTRNAEPNPLDLLACDGEPPPTLEEIRSWGRSFDKLMKSPAGRKVFRDFLRCEYSEENILFWLACEELKKESNPDAIEEKARFIYEDYISILSPKEVSLDSRVRELVNKNMVDPTPCTFDEAQLQIYTLMHRDSYPRFVNSALYRQIAQLDSNNGNGSQQASPARSAQVAGGGGGGGGGASTVSSGGGAAAGSA